MGDPSASSQNGSDSNSTQKKSRRGTRMTKLLQKCKDGDKLSIDFDQSTGLPIGHNRKAFIGHVASLARDKVSILTNEWDEVHEDVKKKIWATIDVILIIFVIIILNYSIVVH